MEPERRSLGEIASDVVQDLGALLREEVALAKAELRQTAAKLAGDSALAVVGGALVYIALLALVAAAILALATAVAPWLAALIVGGAILVLGIILLLAGMNRFKRLNVVPERTLRTVREDVEEVRERL